MPQRFPIVEQHAPILPLSSALPKLPNHFPLSATVSSLRHYCFSAAQQVSFLFRRLSLSHFPPSFFFSLSFSLLSTRWFRAPLLSIAFGILRRCSVRFILQRLLIFILPFLLFFFGSIVHACGGNQDRSERAGGSLSGGSTAWLLSQDARKCLPTIKTATTTTTTTAARHAKDGKA